MIRRLIEILQGALCSMGEKYHTNWNDILYTET